MSDDIQLSDLLESYPSADTPGIQTLISAKEEFREMASVPKERLLRGVKGQYFKHQHFTHRFLRAYDNILIISETGSGKSCEIIGFTEKVLKEKIKAQTDPDNVDEKLVHFKRVVIIVKGPSQAIEFKNQIICQCSDGTYENEINTTQYEKEYEREKDQVGAINRTLHKAGYEVETFETFIKMIQKTYFDKGNEDLFVRDYSDTIFVVDEAHNLLINPDLSYKEKEVFYEILRKILHLAKRSKRILATATPMINDVSELKSLINLFLPFGEEIPEDMDLNSVTLEEIEPYFRGKINFIKATDVGAKVVEQGEVQNEPYEIDGVMYTTKFKIYTTEMSEFQSEAYERAVAESNSLHGPEIQAGNFVFPDGFWGTGNPKKSKKKGKKSKGKKKEASPIVLEGGVIVQGEDEDREEAEEVEEIEEFESQLTVEERKKKGKAFDRYVITNGINYRPTAEFRPYLTAYVDDDPDLGIDVDQVLSQIAELSCKFAEIVRLVMVEEDTYDEEGNLLIPGGNCFIYSEDIKGSGLIVLALCLEALGFERFDENNSIFTGLVGTGLKPVCASSSSDASTRRVKDGFLSRSEGAPLRYVIIHGGIPKPKRAIALEAFNSYENRHGEYIKVILLSETGKEGLNINNIRQEHLVESAWNQSSNYQALSRGIRATSHYDLIAEAKQRLIEQGEEPEDAKVEIFIYKHAAISLSGNSIDIHMYRESEKKDRSIKRLMRMMKQVSVGCWVHMLRNINLNAEDYSAECDYDVCQYVCYDPKPDYIDYSTYDVLYSRNVVNSAIKGIVRVFRSKSSMDIDQLFRLLKEHRKKIVLMALEELIRTKRPMMDRFGYTAYLREDSGVFYLERTFPSNILASYPLSYYSKGIIAVEKSNLNEVVAKLESGENIEIIEELEQQDINDEDFINKIAELSIDGKATLLEETIKKEVTQGATEFSEAVVQYFQKFVFAMNEPVTELQKKYDELNKMRTGGKRRGRPAKAETKRRVKKLNKDDIEANKLVRDEDSEMVYLHTLYTQTDEKAAYGKTSKFMKAEGRLRLFKPSEGDWRDLNEIEYHVYNAFLQIEIYNRQKELENTEELEGQPIYGLYVPGDPNFKIVDKTTEKAKSRTDSRFVNPGRKCTIWKKAELYDLMWKIDFPEPEGNFPTYKEADRRKLAERLSQFKIKHTLEEINTWPLEQIVYYYKWFSSSGITVKEMCKMLEEYMRETGRFLE